MSDLSRQDAIDILKRNYPSSCFEDLCKAVDIAIKALSADVQPVQHGKWIKAQPKGITSYGDGFAECDKCHKVSWLGWNDKYCRNCGARMVKYTGMDGE